MGSLERQRQSADATAAGRSDPFPAGTNIARYRILSLIGSGAMGDVYRAHDRALGRDIALKVLPLDLVGDRERVRRFAHEARAASALSHPHIVGIHEVGHAKPVLAVQQIGERAPRRTDVHYIAMEFVDGETLREAFANGMPLRRSIEIMAQVADGLGKAHAAGIIHRDLKPDNILVSGDGYAKIVDFGLAKLTDTSWNPIGADSPTLRALTAHGELLGTPGYMAPEQIVGKPLDARADIFSFGCILYEAIARVRAFEAESFVDTLYKIIHEEPTPLSQLAPATPPELQRIVERCLAKDREGRYQSIRDLAADLRQWHGESGPRATPVLAAAPINPKISARAGALFALIALVPILAFLLFKRAPAAAPVIEASVRKVTSDGRATMATISPDGRYVSYLTNDAAGLTLWLEQIATGRTIQIVPASNAHYMGISFSRDGEYVYFTRYDNGPLGTLYRVPILGGTAEPLVKDIDSRATLSPDSKQLAFVRDDFNKGTSTILVANADGTNERQLAQFRVPDRVFAPSWSPDGSRIAATHTNKLVAVDARSGAVKTIDIDMPFQAVRGVAWRDADHVVTAGTVDEAVGHFRLWSVEVDSGKTEPLTSDLTELYGPTISDSGAIAAMQVIRQSNVFEVSTDGGIQQLTSGVGAATGFSGVTWLGDRIIYGSVADGQMDLFSRAGTDIRKLTNDAAYESRPTVAPNGAYIVYIASADRAHTLWRVAPDGSDRRKLTDGPRDEAFAISPDSKSIAYATLDAKTKEWVLWVMPSEGGERRRVASKHSILEDLRFTHDGKTILFTGYEGSMLRLYRVPVSGGTPKLVVDGRAHDAQISPDGTMIAAPGGSPELMHAEVSLIPMRGGAQRTLEYGGAMYLWHPNGKMLSYVREEEGAMNLYLRGLDGSAPKKLTWFSDGSIVQYDWNRDGSRAAVTHVIDAVDVVLLK
ncbi:MAG TPA: protein kinase [Thermoanaerobaculia bacterium]|nr:protein kinase [Thermoanaerobaculia bacterium]